MAFFTALRTSTPAWYVKNSAGRRAFHKHKAELNDIQKRIVSDLQRDGIALTSIDELFSFGTDRDRIDNLFRYVGDRLSDPAIRGVIDDPHAVAANRDSKEAFLFNLFEGDYAVLDPAHPLVRVSLSRTFLDPVSHYLGTLPKFRTFFFQATLPVPGGTTPFASQRWHNDPDDRRMVKVFIYFNDVDEGTGPFTYIRKTHQGGAYRHRFPDFRKNRHPNSEFIQRNIPPEDILLATGKKGTVIFCDTNGVHRGGYATSKKRIMLTSVYTTPASFLPTRHKLTTSAHRSIVDPVTQFVTRPGLS